jgi:hypothetical protein
MELSQKILEFYDEMCDGHGVAKMIYVGGKKNIPSDKIKLAAKETYYQHMTGDKVTQLTAAKKVYRLAKSDIIRSLQYKENIIAKDRDELLRRIERLERKIKPFSTKLFDWWPDEVYFY